MNVSVSDAKANFSELVRRAEAGESIVLTRNGKPVAVLREPGEARHLGQLRMAAMGKYRGQLKIADDFDDLGPEWDEYVS
ncbi:type II toxin-antitoxin system Phd/YefM family antitoxin [Jannaschia sp. CCS1]|uniref:type II toxin-antitoxin system Phd/YefM family antitoxin n=1 Tax=Jannaschia sp. (strain CCS1) TaxID=290400 RepID=UPI0005C5569E|nr:type II toxin-antitoxin system prevent-host-death family antitoxin [Jannaschia sp. CCS1]